MSAFTRTEILELGADLCHRAAEIAAEQARLADEAARDGAAAALNAGMRDDPNRQAGRRLQRLAQQATARMARLQALLDSVGPLAAELDAVLAEVGRRRASASAPSGPADPLDEDGRLTLLEQRILHLRAQRLALQQARVGLGRALEAERLALEPLRMAAEVSLPLRRRDLGLRALAGKAGRPEIAAASVEALSRELLAGSVAALQRRRR